MTVSEALHLAKKRPVFGDQSFLDAARVLEMAKKIVDDEVLVMCHKCCGNGHRYCESCRNVTDCRECDGHGHLNIDTVADLAHMSEAAMVECLDEDSQMKERANGWS